MSQWRQNICKYDVYPELLIKGRIILGTRRLFRQVNSTKGLAAYWLTDIQNFGISFGFNTICLKPVIFYYFISQDP